MIKRESIKLNTCQKIKDIKNNCFIILGTILQYTSNLNKRSPSEFDNNSNINGSCSALDNYDFEDLFKFCIKMLKISDNILVLIMMYIDKIIANRKFIVCNENVNKLFYTCLMITQIYYEDNSLNNKTYADLVGINYDDLLKLEMEFMNLVNFELFIKEEDFQQYKQKINQFFSNYNLSKKGEI